MPKNSTFRKGYGRALIAIHESERVVVKIGPGMQAQGEHARRLGKVVCPEVYDVFSRGYTMERLWDSGYEGRSLEWAKNTVCRVVGMLINNVWSGRHERSVGDWTSELVSWCLVHHGYNLRPLIDELYGSYCDTVVGQIHGDPTLSNVLWRGGTEIAIADPLPPGGKIPAFAEVDIAKVAQSVLGWESVAHGWPYYDTGLIEPFLVSLQREPRARRVLFWLMVHLFRIVPYTTVGSPQCKWAKLHAGKIYSILQTKKEVDLCSTLTILTARSPTHAKRSTRRTKR